jgi:hypothetical protein
MVTLKDCVFRILGTHSGKHGNGVASLWSQNSQEPELHIMKDHGSSRTGIDDELRWFVSCKETIIILC